MTKERYPPEIIEQIRNSVYLPDLLQRYTRLNRHNKGLCPFHREKHPSFTVDGKKGLWHCFGCLRGGDIFSFVMEAERVTFSDAVKLLAFEAGIRLPESDTIKETLSKKWEEKKKRLDKLDYLEVLFKDLENDTYDLKRFEMRCLPSKEIRTAKDYTKELLIERDFDILDGLVEERISIFENMKREVRSG